MQVELKKKINSPLLVAICDQSNGLTHTYHNLICCFCPETTWLLQASSVCSRTFTNYVLVIPSKPVFLHLSYVIHGNLEQNTSYFLLSFMAAHEMSKTLNVLRNTVNAIINRRRKLSTTVTSPRSGRSSKIIQNSKTKSCQDTYVIIKGAAGASDEYWFRSACDNNLSIHMSVLWGRVA